MEKMNFIEWTKVNNVHWHCWSKLSSQNMRSAMKLSECCLGSGTLKWTQVTCDAMDVSAPHIICWTLWKNHVRESYQFLLLFLTGIWYYRSQRGSCHKLSLRKLPSTRLVQWFPNSLQSWPLQPLLPGSTSISTSIRSWFNLHFGGRSTSWFNLHFGSCEILQNPTWWHQILSILVPPL